MRTAVPKILGRLEVLLLWVVQLVNNLANFFRLFQGLRLLVLDLNFFVALLGLCRTIFSLKKSRDEGLV